MASCTLRKYVPSNSARGYRRGDAPLSTPPDGQELVVYLWTLPPSGSYGIHMRMHAGYLEADVFLYINR